jgi:segregation and condensation protein A
VAPIRISVRDVVDDVAARLRRSGRLTFRDLTREAPNRLTIIVSFLAVLELTKQGLVDLDQAVTFGELEVFWVGDDTAVDSASVEDYAG